MFLYTCTQNGKSFFKTTSFNLIGWFLHNIWELEIKSGCVYKFPGLVPTASSEKLLTRFDKVCEVHGIEF